MAGEPVVQDHGRDLALFPCPVPSLRIRPLRDWRPFSSLIRQKPSGSARNLESHRDASAVLAVGVGQTD
jgi:hypothetical protein